MMNTLMAPVVTTAGRGVPWLDANMGGPMSRSRTERIRSTILGNDEGSIRCPRVIRLGLRFSKGDDPVTIMTSLIEEEGYGSPEDLRDDFVVPDVRLICRPLADDSTRLPVDQNTSRQAMLEQALMLGLCSSQVFDPTRSVLWTQTSLTRGLELFDPTGFYA
jgi:hypothetical protein